MNTFQITTQLEQVYPSSAGELCCKHSTLLNQLQHQFQKHFPMESASHFVVAKLVLPIAEGPGYQLSMATEQAVIGVVSSNQDNLLKVQGNMLNEEAIFEGFGKMVSGSGGETVQQIAQMVELATQDLSLTKVRGGCVYLYCPPNITHPNITHSFLLSSFMSALVVNGLAETYSVEELVNRLKPSQLFQGIDIQEYLQGYLSSNMLFKCGYTVQRLTLTPKTKLIFISKQLNSLQVNHEPAGCQKGLQYPEMLAQGHIDFEQFIVKHEQAHKFSQLAIQLKQQLNIQTLSEAGQYIIFPVPSHKAANIIAFLTKNYHSLSTQNPNPDNPERLQTRFSSGRTKNLYFSSVPSPAVSILDPSSALWFEA